MDPFLDLIGLLRPRAALLGRGLDATGDWGLSFPKRDDLLFFWIGHGGCLLVRPGFEPLSLSTGDFVLLRTTLPFTLTSNIGTEPVDSVAAVAAKQGARLTLGAGSDRPVSLHMGKFLFAAANEDLVTGLLPVMVHIPPGAATRERVQSLLSLLDVECRAPGPASDFVIVRLIELTLVEILRMPASDQADPHADGTNRGLLRGLRDPVIEKALKAMHADVAGDWTVESLARLCGQSRSAFATRFRSVVGTGPIAYLLRWRMALAKDALKTGTARMEDIAFSIGFKSSSAFSTAFTRAVGCSPRRYADTVIG